jgi:hypothetical protein
LAGGEYLAVHDHDDISLPSRLEKQVAFLDANPHVGVVSSWNRWIGERRGVSTPPVHNFSIKLALMTDCPICHPAAMIRKSVLVENNIGYEARFSPAEDYRLWCRLMDFTDFHNLPEVLLDYRWFAQNTSSQQREKISDLDMEIKQEVRERHPCLWEMSRNHRPLILDQYRLFGVLPLFSIRKKHNGKTKILLFGVLPLLTIARRYPR